MNRIVKRHLPVSKLPRDWQVGLPKDAEVRVEIEVEAEQKSRRSIASLVGTGRNVHGSESDILAHVARLRADR